MITFNAAEVFEMAEQIERNGAAFYRKAAGLAAAKATAELLLDLARMEDDHERVFSRMRSSLPPEQQAESAFDPEGEGALYLHAMVQGRVFDFQAVPAEQLSGGESLEEILRTAIDLEKNSIIFYHTLKKMVSHEAGKARIDDVIDQEISHIATLSKKLGAAT